MKKIFLILCIILIASPSFSQGIKWFDGSLDEAKIEAKKHNKLILIDFSQKSG